MTDYIDHAKIGKTIMHRNLVKACVPDGCEVVDRFLPRVRPVLVIPDSRQQREFVEANRERIEAEWDSYSDGRGNMAQEMRQFAEANRARIDADWESGHE